MQKSWLITAFEPFADRIDNNSQIVLNEIKTLTQGLNGASDWPYQFHFLDLPVEYDRCYDVLKSEIARLKKQGVTLEGVLSIGEGAEEFKIETQANNLDDVAILADNKGVIRVGQKIISSLDQFATIPLRFPFEAFARIRTSKNPGYYICNHLCARMAYDFSSDLSQPYFGFIHVPRTGQGGVFTADVCAAMIVNGFKKIG